MKVFKTKITAEDIVEEPEVETLSDIISYIKDNFNFFLDGLEIMERKGYESEAMALIKQFDLDLDQYITDIGNNISEE